MAAKWLRRIAYRLGYDLSFRRLPQFDVRRRALGLPRDMGPAFADLYEKTADFTLTSPERMYALYGAVRYLVEGGIGGDFVECGVWRGGSCMLMAHTLLSAGERGRRIHLYDTFAGMTKPGAIDIRHRDRSEQVTRWELSQKRDHNTWAYAPLAEVQQNMRSTGYPEERLIFVEGEIENTLPARLPGPIALLRLDTDWYESTYHELCHLYPLLVPGGVLVLDDYGSFEGARRAVDQYLEETGSKLLLHRIDATGRIALKPA